MDSWYEWNLAVLGRAAVASKLPMDGALYMILLDYTDAQGVESTVVGCSEVSHLMAEVDALRTMAHAVTKYHVLLRAMKDGMHIVSDGTTAETVNVGRLEEDCVT